MSKTDPNLKGKLAKAPTYQAALAGQWTAPGMPNTPGFRAENLRAAARQDGIEIPSGYKFEEGSGSFIDANADHWYSDPRVLGPIAVGAVGGIGALAGAGAAGAGGAAAAAPEIGLTTSSAAGMAAPAVSSIAGPSAVGSIGGATTAGGGASWLSRLGSSDVLGAAGRGLGAYSEGLANNRGAEFGGQADLERVLLQRDALYQDQQVQREQEGRASGQDAWRRLQSAQHTLSPGPRPQLSPYSVAPRQATGAELSGAEAMTAEVMARLQGGNPIKPVVQRPSSIDPRLLKPGTGERISGWASPILTGAAAYFGRR